MAYIYAQINKATLVHIVTSKRVTTDFIASRIKVSKEKIEQWLDISSTALPTLNQAKEMAACLHTPFVALYMNPQDIKLQEIPSIKNMRSMYDERFSDDSSLHIAIIDLLLERSFLADAQAELGIAPPAFNPIIPQYEDVTLWASEIRRFFDIRLDTQYKCTSQRKFYLYLRSQIEKRGIFVHCFTDVPLAVARGLAIYDSSTPIIGVNEDDRPPAKSFSIIHEIVHLFKRESSLCNETFNSFASRQEEIFCNAVAGEVLVPRAALDSILQSSRYKTPYSLDDIKKIADRFSVSREVIIRRLLDIQKIDETEYHSYADDIHREIERDKEEQRIARQEGRAKGFAQEPSLLAVDRTSPAVCTALFQGYCESIYSKRDIANHIGIDQKYVDKFLMEVSSWIK